jgi:hypothetical protein
MTSRSEVPAEFQTAANMATDRQLEYITGLLAEREIPDEARDRLKAAVENKTISKKGASEYIERLRSKPKRAGATSDRPTVSYEDIELDNGETRRVGRVLVPNADGKSVLAGRYGIDTTGDDRFTNDTTFFKLWVGDRGGWKVRMFKSDDEVDISFPTQIAVVKVIAKDPEKAMALFGHEFGKCGVCGRGLTNDLSREIGIGPICRTRL